MAYTSSSNKPGLAGRVKVVAEFDVQPQRYTGTNNLGLTERVGQDMEYYLQDYGYTNWTLEVEEVDA